MSPPTMAVRGPRPTMPPGFRLPKDGVGSGSGVVRLLVDPNNGGARSATLTIAGQNFTLAQAGCQVSLKPTNYDAGRGPDDIRINVTADPGCQWSTANTASWVTVAEGRNGTGMARCVCSWTPTSARRARPH